MFSKILRVSSLSKRPANLVSHTVLILVLILAGTLFSTTSIAQTQVFACEPEWASLATAIGGDKVQVFQATTAFQDPHHVEARPSLIAKMRKADLLICTGADLETAWLPLLLRSASNKKVQPGSLGYLEAALEVERLEIPTKVDRTMGDVHSQGNPHVHLDPNRMSVIAKKLTERLSAINPEQEQQFNSNLQQFQSQLDLLTQQSQSKIKSLEGNSYVIYHNDWQYLFDWIKASKLATIESKPGIPPSTSDLKRLLNEVSGKKVNGIVMAAYQNDRAAKWLAKRTGLPVIKLPYTVGGSEKSTDLISLYQESLELLIKHSKQQ